jgi:UDP-glucose 4-epimerase
MLTAVLVTGANGAIGQTLIQHLLTYGYQVRSLVHNHVPNSSSEAIEILQGDIADTKILREAVNGIDIVFHLAAKLHINNPPLSLKDEYERVNIEGTRRLVEASSEAKVKRLVFFSTINVYGASRPEQVFDESSPLRPDSWYAESKARAEQIVLKNVPSVVLRLAAVYGPRMKGNYPRLLNALKRNKFAMIGDGSNRRTLVHIDDVCSAAITTAEHDEALGKIYNVTDGNVHALRDIVESMSLAIGQAPPRFSIPKRPARFVAGIVEDGLRIVGKTSPIGRSTIDKFVEDIAVSGIRIQKEIGYQPQYDLMKGWRETVRQLNH